ncbi:hypothetical protein BKK79_24255 [Cupriavidus sp. USMAA2-4]|uniref:hypothetical protein n=1 Tax=Cupriavidus sp. USMAA2-4 TaxID=876364 RepID=UPI0008A6A5E3|nr:hypothetical protein [Cupriavidus sp. USMAA2-4]AOY94962.1 hypothetical protein BKK79_24255 [Cupriavidus sp. USMAA2-4]
MRLAWRHGPRSAARPPPPGRPAQDDSGALALAGSSAEIVRRQPDGSWRYVVDHATGASLPRVA